MEPLPPSAEDVRALLAPFTMRQIFVLAAMSGVSWTTIYKIKRNETRNPGVETLRRFMPYVANALAAHPPPAAA